jgi:Na+-translocating ferredoxin:NAD+ oxidoreductase RNF subunit RnfB
VGYSRRGLFSLLVRPIKATSGAGQSVVTTAFDAKPKPPELAPENRMAIIQGRHCIAESHGCAVCIERCPVEGAMVMDHGLPMVVAETCTGCGICYEVCPAPTNAVMWVERKLPADQNANRDREIS